MSTTPATSAPAASAPAASPSPAPASGAPAPSNTPAAAPSPAGASPAPGGGQGAPPAARSEEELVNQIFGYDPFKSEPAPAAPTPPAPAAAQAPPTPEVPPVQGAQPPAQNGHIPLADLQASIERLASTVAQGQQPTQPAVDPIEQVDIPSYALPIPDQLITHLQSQNPAEFRQGVQALVQGTLQHAHKAIVVAMRREIGRFLPEAIGMQVRQHTEQQRVFNDFYGKFPQLGNPALRPLVVHVGQQVASEMRAAGQNVAWNEQLRDAIGARVMQMLTGLVPQAAAQPAAPAAPAFVPTGASPAPTPPQSDFAKQFAEFMS